MILSNTKVNERLLQNPLEEIRKIDQHIGSNASDKLLEEIVRETAFSEMKKHKQASEEHLEIVFKGSMYRKGVSGRVSV